MDGLWDPPNYQATEEATNSFSLHKPIDTIEQTALNVKSCIQVLRILITKADADTIELEQELMDLMTQLARTNAEFSDMFTNFLRVEIDLLDLSIRKLKIDGLDSLSTSREPTVESLNDIMKTVFCRFIQKKDEQKFADIGSSSSNNQMCAENPSNQIACSSNSNQIEKTKRIIIIPPEKEKHSISQTRVKIEEENANYYPSNINHFGARVPKYSSLEMNKFQIKRPIMTKEIIIAPTCKSICQKTSMEAWDNWKHQGQLVKYQLDNESVGSTSIHSLESSPKQPDANQNTCTELGFPLDNPEEQPPILCLPSLDLPSTKTYKRRRAPWPASSSSAFLLEGPKPKPKPEPEPEPEPLSTMEADLDMDYYTVEDLKAIARKRKLKGFYKLRKAQLAELLGIKVTEGKRKVKKRERVGALQIYGPPDIGA